MRIRLSTESIQSVRWERNKHDFDTHGKSTCFPCVFVLKHKKRWKGMTRSEHGLEIRGIIRRSFSEVRLSRLKHKGEDFK